MVKYIFRIETINSLQVQFSVELETLLALFCRHLLAAIIFLKCLTPTKLTELHLFHFVEYILAHFAVQYILKSKFLLPLQLGIFIVALENYYYLQN